MKVNRLDAHDRLSYFQKDQSANLFQGVDDCLKKNKDCVEMQQNFPYVYIFAHPRTDDDGVTKRMLWQPRLTKPRAQTNSYLFRVVSGTDLVEIVWMLPPKEMWDQYQKGKLTECKEVIISIENYTHKRKELESPHPEDWSEDRIRKKLIEIHDIATRNGVVQ